ncbi:MAG: hypothetical protein QOE41_2612, partial [Mycobacterium sp.]|nr:hypothetical protein [Mycobacterium sp.]
ELVASKAVAPVQIAPNPGQTG